MPEDDKKIPVNLKFDVQRDIINETRGIVVALKNFKDAVTELPAKKIRILSDWIIKWALLLRNESKFNPSKLKRYKQREIILVDFGFNVDGEFGGRHYAVVLEKANNPKSSVILVAPITSYDSEKNEKAHAANVDLGVGAINDYVKGAEIVTNQLRYVSKMRIEKPKTSMEPRAYVTKEQFSELLTKIQNQICLTD